ncbi:MAG: GntR family transcriptional regulator [Nocardioidaceae bacterium]|nr:MAG: GntR family transcriptional regulator [Nocardioidaceae bacterium]
MNQPAVHKHVIVREYVRGLIEGAEPGSPAPSERELVQQFKVARMTVRQALDALVAEGLLERIPGRGTFVARGFGVTHNRLVSFTEDMSRRGMKTESRTLLARREQSGPSVARALEIEQGETVVHWRRLRFADGAPMCVEDAFLADRVIPAFLENPLPFSLYSELDRRGLRPSWAEDSINADVAHAEEAGHLGLDDGAAVLRIDRRAFAGQRAVEVSRSTYRADRYTVWMPLARTAPRH